MNIGDKVIITNDGLRWDSKRVPAHVGYSTERIEWRSILNDFCDRGVVGIVTHIFDSGSGNINVEFEGQVVEVHCNMVTVVVPYRTSKVAADKWVVCAGDAVRGYIYKWSSSDSVTYFRAVPLGLEPYAYCRSVASGLVYIQGVWGE